MKYSTSLIIGLCIFLCVPSYSQNLNKLSSKALKKNEHCKSAILASKSLQNKPEKNKKAQSLLAESYPEAVRMNELRIRNLQQVSMAFFGDETVIQKQEIVNKYDSLMILQQEYSYIPEVAKRSKKLNLNFSQKDYGSAYEEAKTKLLDMSTLAAEMHYQEGIVLMKSEEIEHNRAAMREFTRSQSYVSSYKDSEDLFKEARKKGTKRIALIPFADKSYMTNYGEVGERIVDLVKAKTQNKLKYLVEFIPPLEVANALNISTLDINDVITPASALEVGNELKIDEAWIGQITQLLVPVEDVVSRNTETLTRSVVVGEEKYINKKGKEKTRNVYADVSATVYKYTKTNEGTLNYSFQIIDVRKKEYGSIEASSETVSNSHEYYRFSSGDKRAFTHIETRDMALPSFIERANKLIEDVSSHIAVLLLKREKEIHIPLKTKLEVQTTSSR
ncbi:MAG: hypothetical protein AAF388_03955 [Bacteroidota bacterium]